MSATSVCSITKQTSKSGCWFNLYYICFHLPTIFSASDTVFSNNLYLSLVVLDVLLHLRASNLFVNSIWKILLVSESWSFSHGLTQGFPLVDLSLHTSLMLTIQSSHSNIKSYALRFLKKITHVLFIKTGELSLLGASTSRLILGKAWLCWSKC